MSNGIQDRQNEENSICMLAAQRQIYSETEVIGNLIIGISVVLPVMFACMQIFIKNNIVLNTVVYILPIISMVIGRSLTKYIEKEKETAAFIQQKFDIYVYQMPWDKRIFGEDKNMTPTIAEKATKHFNKEGAKEALRDWYSSSVDTFPIKKGILECQKENFWWDVGLRKRYRIASIVLIILLASGILIIGIVQNETISKLVCRMAFVLPLIQWLYETEKELSSDIRRLEKLDAELYTLGEKNMEDLQDIQKDIYEHRKSCHVIPNFFYKIFKENDEDKAKRIIQMEVRN